MTRLIRLVGGLALLAICIGGLIDIVGHIRAAESAWSLIIAVLTFLIVLAFALIGAAMIVAGFSSSGRGRRKR